MPKKLHDKLVREARKKGFTGERFRRYVFGTVRMIEKRKRK